MNKGKPVRRPSGIGCILDASSVLTDTHTPQPHCNTILIVQTNEQHNIKEVTEDSELRSMVYKGSISKLFLFQTAIAATARQPSAAFISRASPILLSSATSRQNLIRHHSTTRSSLFESMRNGYYKNTNNDEISLGKLLEKATSVLSTSPTNDLENLNDSDRLFFSSCYDASGSKHDENMTTRGFSNWILPGKIMVGQYPGRVPETNTPKQHEVDEHLRRVLFHNTNSNGPKHVCFVSLQSELPPQDDYESWNKQNGEIYLGDSMEWPNPFSHYAPSVEKILTNEHNNHSVPSVRYIHHPIQDLSVPSNSKNLRLLLWKILDVLDCEHSTVYIHCWGGRGRAGLTASCLLTLLGFASTNPPFDAQSILEIVQTGYSSRLGSENMPKALSRSPQTDSQRSFVNKFFDEVQQEALSRSGI